MRAAVYQNPGCVVFYFNQIRREPVGAVNVINKLRKLIVRDCLLVVFENFPSRLVPEDTIVFSRLEACCKDCRE
jgi:hypothetical protein